VPGTQLRQQPAAATAVLREESTAAIAGTVAAIATAIVAMAKQAAAATAVLRKESPAATVVIGEQAAVAAAQLGEQAAAATMAGLGRRFGQGQSGTHQQREGCDSTQHDTIHLNLSSQSLENTIVRSSSGIE
jgi:hypothetical protein